MELTGKAAEKFIEYDQRPLTKEETQSNKEAREYYEKCMAIMKESPRLYKKLASL